MNQVKEKIRENLLESLDELEQQVKEKISELEKKILLLTQKNKNAINILEKVITELENLSTEEN